MHLLLSTDHKPSGFGCGDGKAATRARTAHSKIASFMIPLSPEVELNTDK